MILAFSRIATFLSTGGFWCSFYITIVGGRKRLTAALLSVTDHQCHFQCYMLSQEDGTSEMLLRLLCAEQYY